MDWSKLKAEYIAGGTSYRRLAEKYSIPFSNLKRVAIKERWADLREQARTKADTKLVREVANKNAKNTELLIDVANKLLHKLNETIDMMEVLDSQSLKHYTSALKDLKDIKGVKSDIDLREQEARIKKLIKDTESNYNGAEGKPCGIIYLPQVNDAPTPPVEEEADE